MNIVVACTANELSGSRGSLMHLKLLSGWSLSSSVALQILNRLTLSAAKNLELGRRDAVLFPCRAATTLSVHNSGGLFRPYQALHRIKCLCVTNGRRFHVTLIRESEYKKKHGLCGECIGYRPLEHRNDRHLRRRTPYYSSAELRLPCRFTKT